MSDHDATPPSLTIDEVLALSETMFPLVETTTPVEARTTLATLPRPPGPDMASVEDLDTGGVPLRLYMPHGVGDAGRSSDRQGAERRSGSGAQPPERDGVGDSSPLVVYMHGGGFVIGDVDSSDASVRRLAVALGMSVASVDYRLAPEHPFPAAVNDALAATGFCARLAAEDDRFDGRLLLAGDSAGANLATVSALAAPELGIDVAHQLLVYPCVDPSRSHDSHRTQRSGNFLTSESMAWYWGHYLGDDPASADWRVDPRRSDRLATAPPATVLVAGRDPLHDEGAEYAELLAGAGVSVTVFDFPELFHGFAGFSALVPEAGAALEQVTKHVAGVVGAKIGG